MLAIGGAAGAASFRHVHDVAAAHGQPGWLAWADAVILELASIAAGFEIRRRKRCNKPVGFPAATLTLAVALSLAAQVVEAEASVIGWIAAALPALGFLAMVKMAMARADSITGLSSRVLDPTIGPNHESRIDPQRSGTVPHAHGPVLDSVGRIRAGQDRPRSSVDLSRLLPAARKAAQTLSTKGEPLNRSSLAGQLREDGHALSTATATELVRLLRNEKRPATPADQATADPATTTDR